MPNSYLAKGTAGAFKLQRQFDSGPHDRFRPPVGGGGTRAGLPGPSTRGRTSEKWSKRSQRHMRFEYGALPWEMLGRRPVMITLTYPGDWDVWVGDARELHRQREALKSRWTRRYGTPIGVWVTEFQKRGAPHLHMYMALPDEVSEKEYVGLQKRTMERRRLERDMGRYAARSHIRAPKGDFSMWLRTAWWKIVGSESSKHHGRGVDIATAFFSDKAEAEANRIRVADYFWRESGKWNQKQPPEGFGGLKFYGRWGGKQGFKPVVTEAQVDERTGLELRRVLVRWQQQKMREAARRGGWDYRKGTGGSRGRDGLTVFDVGGREWLPGLLDWASDLASQKAAGPLVRGYVHGAGEDYRRAWSEFVCLEDENFSSDLAPDDGPDEPWVEEQAEWERQEAEIERMLDLAAAREAAIEAQIEKAEIRLMREQRKAEARAANRAKQRRRA